VDFGTLGVGCVLVSEGSVTAQTFVEIESNIFPPFFLEDAARADALSQKIKLGRAAAKPLQGNSIAVCFQRQGAQKAIVSAAVASRTAATLYIENGIFQPFEYMGRCYKTYNDLLPVPYTLSQMFSEHVYLNTQQFSHYTALEVPENASYMIIRQAYRDSVFACHPDKQPSERPLFSM
jgi:hypothetical protein